MLFKVQAKKRSKPHHIPQPNVTSSSNIPPFFYVHLICFLSKVKHWLDSIKYLQITPLLRRRISIEQNPSRFDTWREIEKYNIQWNNHFIFILFVTGKLLMLVVFDDVSRKTFLFWFSPWLPENSNFSLTWKNNLLSDFVRLSFDYSL